jgi:hypothetical protein
MEHVERMREMINALKFLIGKPEGNRLFGRPGRVLFNEAV